MYAVYHVSAQPGAQGSWRRHYVGCVNVYKWSPGGDVHMAVQARVAEHFSKTLGARGATWLRPCSDPSAPTVLSTHAGARDALRAELFFTCATMLAEGELLTRGASFCRVAVPWADVQPLLDRARGADLSSHPTTGGGTTLNCLTFSNFYSDFHKPLFTCRVFRGPIFT